MSTTIKTGWLNDKDGNKFAPKTLTSQVQTSDGILIEDKIQADLDAAKEDILNSVTIDVDDTLSSTSINPVQNKVIDAEFEAISTAMNALDAAIDEKADFDHIHDDRYYTETEIDAKIDELNEAVANAGGSLIVTLTENSDGALSSDKTNIEIYEAYLLGKSIYAKLSIDNLIYPLIYVEETYASFSMAETYEGNAYLYGIEITEEGVTAGMFEAVGTDFLNETLNDYETKIDAETKLTEAKAYSDTNLDSAKAYTDDLGNAMATTLYGDSFPEDGNTTIRGIANDEANIALDSAKEYTDTKTSGLASTSVVNTSISTHNTSTSAHSDIRALITDLTAKLNNFLDVDDTTTDQLSEVLTLIENNKGTLESLTSSKINVSDIVNNLTTNSTSKVLSAAQGVAIKALIDALQSELDSHTHAIADVSGLQTALDGKAASSHGTHVTYSTTAPVMDGTASVGTASTVARSDHKHPTDTSRASKTDFDTHVADTTKHITSTERTNWNAAKTHADSAHAPSNAEKNQNAFSNVKVGSTTVAADTTTDTLEIAAGVGISVVGDATNDKVTITNSGVIAVSTGSSNGTISVNTNGTSANVAVKGLGSAAYTDSSAYATAGHTHTVDTALSSSSTNPVQNKVVNSAITSLTSTVSANTSSISAHSTSISNLQTAVAEFEEITSAEIQALFA